MKTSLGRAGAGHRKRTPRGGGLLLSGALTLALLAPAFPAQAAVSGTVRASVSTTGAQAKDGATNPFLSADGRYVAFSSDATNFDARCRTANRTSVYVRDLQLGRTECVSVNNAGVQGEGGSWLYGISADGRYVLYEFGFNNADLGSDVYVYDRQTRTRRQVDPGVARRDYLGDASISADGKVVAFAYDDGFNTETSVTLKVRDLVTGALTTVPRAAASTTCLSRDGRYVFHYGFVRDQAYEVVRYDRATGQRRYVAPEPADVSYSGFSCSDDGRKVVFADPNALLSSDTNGQPDVYLATLSATGRTLRQVSREVDGRQRTGPSARPAVSPDGNYIIYTAQVSGRDLASTYALNLTTNVTWLVSRGFNGQPATPGPQLGISSDVATTPSGRAVLAHASPANNLVPGDTNNQYDVFVTSLG